MSDRADQTSTFNTKFVDTRLISRFRIGVHLALFGVTTLKCLQSSAALTPNALGKSIQIISRFQPTKYPHHGSMLMMSSIGQDPDTENTVDKFMKWMYSKLPDPPEDQISIIGDIGGLFLYSSLDHFVNGLYDDYLNSPETIQMKSALTAIESSVAASSELSAGIANDHVGSLPVWFDALSCAPFGNVPLNSALPLEHHITYSPAISTAGSASVLLCTVWLICGYFTEAFHFKNTMECSRTHAILITSKTWIFTSIIMMLIAYGSDVLVGSINGLHKTIGLSRVDTDFIFDSLSVLLVWRYILSLLFGPSDGSSD